MQDAKFCHSLSSHSTNTFKKHEFKILFDLHLASFETSWAMIKYKFVLGLEN